MANTFILHLIIFKRFVQPCQYHKYVKQKKLSARGVENTPFQLQQQNGPSNVIQYTMKNAKQGTLDTNSLLNS